MPVTLLPTEQGAALATDRQRGWAGRFTAPKIGIVDNDPTPSSWAFAEELAQMPTSWTRLLDTHHADAGGRCRGCRTQSGPAQPWPCTLYRAAAHARRIASR